MENIDSVILISPNIGEYHDTNIFLRSLNQDELKFLEQENFVIEYKRKHNSYIDCLNDIKTKIKKIKAILEE